MSVDKHTPEELLELKQFINDELSKINSKVSLCKSFGIMSDIGIYERSDKAQFDEVGAVRSLLTSQKHEGVMIDVGGHSGSSTIPFLREGWNVYVFEPDPNNRARLTINLSKFDNYLIDERAVSDVDGEEVQFYASDESTGISGLSAFTENHKELCTVKTVTLSSYCKEYGIESIDFLKIDAEGFEKMILDGFPWDKIQPAAIVCEFEDSKTVPLGYDYYDLADYLVDKGYVVYVSEWHPIIRYGITHDWLRIMPYPDDLSNKSAWGNLIAFKEEPNKELFLSSIKKNIKTVNKRFKDEGCESFKQAAVDETKLNLLHKKLEEQEFLISDLIVKIDAYDLLLDLLNKLAAVSIKTDPLRKIKRYKDLMRVYATLK